MKNPLKIYTPKIFSKINKLIPFQTTRLATLKGDMNLLEHIQQIALVYILHINGYNFT